MYKYIYIYIYVIRKCMYVNIGNNVYKYMCIYIYIIDIYVSISTITLHIYDVGYNYPHLQSETP